MKKGDKFICDWERMKKRHGKSVKDYGEIEFIEMYSTNLGTAHFKTKFGEEITLKLNEVIKI